MLDYKDEKIGEEDIEENSKGEKDKAWWERAGNML